MTRRCEPSAGARRVVIGAAIGLPRTYRLTADAFRDERARVTEHHLRPGLLPAIHRALRALLTPKGPKL